MTETQVVNFYDDVDENEDEEANDTDVQHREPLAKLSWKGEQFELYEGDNLIGRDKACEVMLDHKSVSGKHAEITLTRNGTAIIRDLRSANGTFVETPIGSDQYQRLTISYNRRELLNGMKIRVGMVCCEFSLLDSSIQDGLYAETQMLPGIGAALETQFLPELDQDYESSMASFHTAIAIPQGEMVNPVKMSVNSTSAVRFDVQQHVTKSDVIETRNIPIYPPEIATMVDNSTQLLDITPGSISMSTAAGQPLNPMLTVPTDSITTAITTNVNIPGVRTVRATERITVSASTRVASQSTHGSDVPTQMDLELIRHIQHEHDSEEKGEEEEENNSLQPKDVLSSYDSGDDEEDEERSQDIMQVEGEDDQTDFIGGGEWVSSKNEHPVSRDTNDYTHRVLSTRTLIEADTMDADTDDEQVTTPAKVNYAETNTNNTLIDPPISNAVTDDHSTYISTAVNSTQASPDKSQRSTVRIESSTAVPTPDILELRKSAATTSASPDMNPIVTPIDMGHSGKIGMVHSTTDVSHTGNDIQQEEKDWLSSTPTKKESNKRNTKRDSNCAGNSSSSNTSIDGSTSRNNRRASRASASKTAIVNEDVSEMKRKLSTIKEGIDESAEPDNMDEDQPQSKKAKFQAKEASVEESVSPSIAKSGRNTRKRNATSMNEEEGDVSSAINTHNDPSETSEGNNNSSSNVNVVTTTKGRGGRKKAVEATIVSDITTTETPVPSKTEAIQNESELTLEDEPIYLMFTKLEESAFQRYLRRLPQITVTNDPRLATHILTTPELKRTPKLLVALNHRVRNVVKEEWLIDSAKSQHPLPLVPNTIPVMSTDNDPIQRQIKAYSSTLRQCKYMVRDEDKEALWRFQLAETLARIRFIPTEERHIFQQIAFYITDGIFGNTAPSQAETKSIIESAGGVLLDDATHALLSLEQFWQPQDTPAGEEEEAVPTKRRRKSAIDTNEFVTENKRKAKEVVVPAGVSQEVQLAVHLCQGRTLVVISHPSVVKKCISKDVVQRLKRHVLEPPEAGNGAGRRSVAPGVYSIEVLYEAVLRQELDLQVHKLDGYDFSR